MCKTNFSKIRYNKLKECWEAFDTVSSKFISVKELSPNVEKSVLGLVVVPFNNDNYKEK